MKVRTTLLVLVLLACISLVPGRMVAQRQVRYFPETGCSIRDSFLRYWQTNGGLRQFGYPLSEAVNDQSSLDGRTYLTQYFERARFEYHPENQPPNDVQLSLLGSQRYQEKYPHSAPTQQASIANPYYFAQTGRTLGGKFRTYWEVHGGLAVQGYPISDEFSEVSEVDGKSYTVQYFERAVFEYHPENKGTDYEVLLTQLGTLEYRAMLFHFGLRGLDMVSPDEGWAIGSVGDRLIKAQGGIILHYYHGRWTVAARPPGEFRRLYTLSMASNEEGWAGGDGPLVHYTNGQWTDDPANFQSATKLKMVSPTEGWALTPTIGGGIIHLKDGRWLLSYYKVDSPIVRVGSLDMISAEEGWLVDGSEFWHYQNGGWHATGLGNGTGNTATTMRGLKMHSANDGWAVGDGGIIYHYDGKVWATIASPSQADLNSVDTSASTAWAVGKNGTIVHYTGQVWQADTSPTSKALYGIKIVSANEAWAVGDAGTILHYQDGVWSVYHY